MKRWKKIVRLTANLLMLLSMLAFMSCVGEESARTSSEFIEDFSVESTEVVEGNVTPCVNSYVVKDAQCLASCPNGTHVALDEEIGIINDELTENTDGLEGRSLVGGLSSELFQLLGISFPTAREICVNNNSRPDKAIFVKRNFCSCFQGKSDILNNCDAVCAGTNTAAPTLTGSVTLGPEVELNPDLGNLFNFCFKEILGDPLTSPSCVLQAFDGQSTVNVPITVNAGSNTFSANLNQLALNKTFVVKIVENGSGSNASSDEFQIRRISPPDDSVVPVGPLKIMPVSEYSCITRAGSITPDGNLFDNAARIHFYFPSNNTPPPLAPGNDFLFCHDINLFGINDSSLFPRLELTPQSYAAWDQSDIRFADLNADNRADINEEIEKELAERFNEVRTVNLFNLFSWPNRPDSENTPPNVGFIMQPFINIQSGLSFCPTQDDYNSNDNLFKVLKDFVGVDTEGIFLAVKDPELLSADDGNQVLAPIDIVIVREGLLKKIRFFTENGQLFVPDDITATQKTIKFFFPPDEVNPLVQKSNQRIYTVRAPQDIGQDTSNRGLETSVRPPDNRFACVPAID
jgi:hypothetical protein